MQKICYIIDMRKLHCPSPTVTKNGMFGCGSCRVCRLIRSREWATRMYHEWKTSGHKALFVLLTYAPGSLPPNGSLRKKDITIYIKRLRRATGKKFRYYISGEYGEKSTRRAHYHLILFGLDQTDRDAIYYSWYRINEAGNPVPMCAARPGCFGCEVIHGEKAFAYTAGYCRKKLGKGYKRFMQVVNKRDPEYSVMSQGIGKEFCLDKLDYTPYMRVSGRKVLKPRYYRKILGITQVDFAEFIEESEAELRAHISAICPSAVRYYDRNMYGGSGYILTPAYYKILESYGRQAELRLYYEQLEWSNRKRAI
ncbi:replication initiation protein [Tortoise microvirus 25]|nr:replication initiation protein [Tortoise microvirus 25]